METNIDFTNIEKSLELLYLNNLIKACEKNNINKDQLEKKIISLNKQKQIDKTLSKTTSNQSLNNATESPQYSDDYLYQKPWTKLTAIHKIIKIKEYVNSLLVKTESDKLSLKEKLVELVKNKILTKKDSVLYDSTKGKIISIPTLEYKDGKYLI
jgi:hypothetical protein